MSRVDSSIAEGLAAEADLERTNLISVTVWTGTRNEGPDGHGGEKTRRNKRTKKIKTKDPENRISLGI